ncbi:MAG: cupin-like domain-containing protein [Nostoc sp. DedQUE04]|uniref:cupin-like domain-containing protein n=1 Tax=Nostoc sp. DedQUE04 TaxID=3075390 RepID=UPI002AD3E827|nr:cupin-like domain-containing protein [Nostoc sp. DedQUE04]MDZ8135359.1 cupin-like domain-containing protein [Nostoc sp. DedQUE04]
MAVINSNSILRIKNPSKKEFVELWKQYQPFLIEGVAEYWDASKKWSNDYLLKQSGNNIIPVEFFTKTYLDNYNYVLHETYNNNKKMKLKEYIDILSEENDLQYYMNEVYLEKYFPELTGDINYPEYFSIKPSIVLWFGSFGKTTTLHFDEIHNIFAQIRGRKRVILFPPSNYLSFYPPLGESGSYPHFSKINPLIPNLELFPKFPWQDKIEVILNAGEMLYIPPLWWHHVTGVDENISLSFWYDVKIKDFFQQKRFLSTTLNILPHLIRHSIRNSNSSLSVLKSIIQSIW